MKSKKEIIKNNFDNASALYDTVASIQMKCAEKLIEKLPYFTPNSILDLGSGTGYITELLLRKLPNSKYTINDISDEMLNVIKKKLGLRNNVEYIHGDMEKIDINFHDLIISNMAIQWTDNIKNMIIKLSEKSQILAFSCPIEGTFYEWIEMFEKLSIVLPIHKLPSYEELELYISHLKSHYFVEEFKLEFDTPSHFTNYLKKLGASYSESKLSISLLKKFVKSYNQKFVITYKIFFCVLVS